MDRRRLIVAAVGTGVTVGGIAVPAGVAAAPTDDELAYANFGLAAEFLLKDFYGKAADAEVFSGGAAHDAARGGRSAVEHVTALTKLLTDAGQTAAVEEDFEFAWPANTFKSRTAASATGLKVTESLLGAYLTAAAAISITSYRALYAAMAANLAQQAAALSNQSQGRMVGVSFPPSLAIEAASAAIDPFLG
jgi:hypothetical protein